ncbi:glycosyltransferase family 1 protein [Bacteroides helcogenes]|uniref:Glycosyl transferase group 1 n=1 Tax=Bacteroides helcogenes (strain ATCC 35417 / DSM 20613 / JCM 6297 / CCUG 15421 / P 36-108) TaxID=693979 RepID=E6SQT6_BACT6|nr:glycosyltransferase family 1 protein [Bacteroides helcogenes]ADV44019.1 glycosyl transferase group 1 [Bacteroides helcogenes P 36-108]MDY5237843.1 glycosyltransferase family 1 protein [Bacteroides helcogenes]
MKIAIEAQRIFRTNKHGMDFVALETIRELQKRNDGNEYYIIVAPGEDRCLEESANLSIIEVACPTYPLWEQIALPWAVRRLGVDLLHCTSNTAPLWCPVPLVLTLHDIIYLEPRQHRSPSLYQEMGWYYRRLTVPRILKKCRKIITVSYFECNRIRKALNIPTNRIMTIYNGYNKHFYPMESIDMQIVNRYIPQKDFLFFLGNTDPKKNAARVLKAYSLYLEKSSVKRPLLIADLKETYIDSLLQQEGISENLKQHLYYPGYISNADLATLYNAAFAFLYPSLRESFGIPLVEAMACGTPVITGNTSSMPEVGGPDILATDPYKPEEIADAVLRLENEATLYQKQREYGLLRAQQFSWEKTADELIKVYQSLAYK